MASALATVPVIRVSTLQFNCIWSCFIKIDFFLPKTDVVEITDGLNGNAPSKNVSSSDPINIISKSIVYQPGNHEVEIINQPGIVQYLVIMRINVPCLDAAIEFDGYDNNGGQIELGDFCGTKLQWCKCLFDKLKMVNFKLKWLTLLLFQQSTLMFPVRIWWWRLRWRITSIYTFTLPSFPWLRSQTVKVRQWGWPINERLTNSMYLPSTGQMYAVHHRKWRPLHLVELWTWQQGSMPWLGSFNKLEVQDLLWECLQIAVPSIVLARLSHERKWFIKSMLRKSSQVLW